MHAIAQLRFVYVAHHFFEFVLLAFSALIQGESQSFEEIFEQFVFPRKTYLICYLPESRRPTLPGRGCRQNSSGEDPNSARRRRYRSDCRACCNTEDSKVARRRLKTLLVEKAFCLSRSGRRLVEWDRY